MTRVGVGMGRGHRAAAAVLVAAAWFLAGCSGSAPSSASLPPITYVPPSVQSAPSQPAPDSTVPQHGLAALCDQATQRAVSDVVEQQLAAFRARDFDAAFALASEQFRAITDAQGLKALISKGHPEVLDSVSHEFTECRRAAPDLVLAAVNVTGSNGNTVLLVYQFALEHEHWRILQSAPMNGHGSQGSSSSDSGDVPAGDV